MCSTHHQPRPQERNAICWGIRSSGSSHSWAGVLAANILSRGFEQALASDAALCAWPLGHSLALAVLANKVGRAAVE